MDAGFIISAFLAGVFMFLAPCTLPLVPGFLSFVGGDEKNKVIKNTLFFIFGFSIVFIFFGILASFAGGFLNEIRNTISFIGGLIIIFFGLYILGLFRFSLFEKNINFSRFFNIKPKTKRGSFILGLSLALGWTPCVGPILASILILASNTETVFLGGFLLFIFSLGLGLPFLLLAFLHNRADGLIKKINKNNFLYKAGGAVLILIGFLLATNNFYLFTRWGFQLLDFIGYEKILNLL